MHQPAHEDILRELAYWERNQSLLYKTGELPEPPPNIPELQGLLDYFMMSKDHSAVTQRIAELKRFMKKNP
jgi:hypothetical protein